MPNQSVTLTPSSSKSKWSVIASFDGKGRLVVNEGNLDDDFYIQVTAGECKIGRSAIRYLADAGSHVWGGYPCFFQNRSIL